ncbi:helix-turn-helix domain-containing protein [Rhodanobacter sp. A1T4]|jgi:transcriptional regulator GlxA family with amidase domain|uniref:GlxA family transcriptional regulator n=1 Tax=Rhodanobacter sp. A1T4 TaxID=2723087 RepID=UPI00161D4D4F|nr:helix-turn-helix domain-containing protein [Rhodanobacter sp. A1T4]MBB6246285.1 transcriptional regulator GlxA family with amidase domain [Rhodanobacter sp. A1T4]
MRQKQVLVLAMSGVQLLDVSGPMDVFAEANVQAGWPAYALRLIACEPGDIESSSGVRLIPDGVARGKEKAPIHTLLVAGSPRAAEEQFGDTAMRWLKTHAPTARRFGSVCSGAFMLAAAGLIDHKRVATHWAVAQQLARAYPNVIVDADAIHVRDGRLRTAAGVTAGLDLALALVEEDLGHDIAKKVASQLVMFFRRPGGQTQFSRSGELEVMGRSSLQELQRWVATHPEQDHSVAALAARLHVSPRHFARIFRNEMGTTPGVWVETIRLAAARQLLEDEHGAPKQVAAQCGFADVDSFRRAFHRVFGLSPAQYRKSYAL